MSQNSRFNYRPHLEWAWRTLQSYFPPHRHHLRFPFIDNTILDFNYRVFPGAEYRRVTVKHNVSCIVRLWRCQMHCLTLKHQEEIVPLDDFWRPLEVVQKNAFSFFRSNSCKAGASRVAESGINHIQRVQQECLAAISWANYHHVTVFTATFLEQISNGGAERIPRHSIPFEYLLGTAQPRAITPGRAGAFFCLFQQLQTRFLSATQCVVRRHHLPRCFKDLGNNPGPFRNVSISGYRLIICKSQQFRDLFRLFNGQLAFFSMCQQVLSKIVAISVHKTFI